MDRFVCGVVIAFTGAACGGGGSGPSVDVSASSLCKTVADVVCYNLYTCCSEGERQNFLDTGEPLDEATCREDMQIYCERSTATHLWSEENDRVLLNSEALEGCLREVIAPDDTCVVVDVAAPWAEACMIQAWTGVVAAGGDCFYDYECAGARAVCGVDRKCIPPAAQGQSCTVANCDVGLYCNGSTCMPLVGEGGNCFSSSQCLETLFCDFDTGRCERPRALGESCNGFSACEAGATCLPGSCADGNICFADTDCNASCADSGSFCFDDSDCGIGSCSVSGFSCFSNFDCNGGTDVCNFPVMCLPSACSGEPTCVENFGAYDYCGDALSAIGIL